MVTALEVPADKLIEKLASYLKENVPEVKPPSWVQFVKTGCFKEKPPEDPDWWYYRAASILRKLYKAGKPVGLSEFRKEYGGRKRRGGRPERSYWAPGNSIRKILQQLEQAQLVRRTREGRILTPQGKALLDRLAIEVLVDVAREKPELAKYLPESIQVKILGSTSGGS
ncbi:MAG: 30S ribosomal protein S19e [Desulfurococcaceae archaeon]|jgi:small subunit ribosomal protein S19e|nr:30S ribosomal protein S19e [Desulfurococcaceae archaeon]